MNILHLISSSGLFGAEKVMLQLAAGLKERGQRVVVAAVENKHNPHLEAIDEAKRLGLETYIVSSGGRFDFDAVDRLAGFVRQNKFDIIHAHNYKANLLAFLAGRKVSVKLATTLHGYIGEGLKLRLYEVFDRWLMGRFDAVIIVDESLSRWFKKGRIKLSLINNGVDIEAFKPCGRKSEKGRVVIGTVGRMSAEKAHDRLLRAFAQLAKAHDNLELLFVGDGEKRNELEALSASLGVRERCGFVGLQADPRPYYEQMDIFVSSSLLEHFPVAVLEAMSCGKAVVATDVGGTKELVRDGETGLLIKAGSSEAIAQGVARFLKDDSLASRLGEAAREYVEKNFSLAKTVEGYVKVYEEVTRQGQASLT